MLKFITCGSVDDGKSTLIGHMLYDAKLIFVDQEEALQLDSRNVSTKDKIDYSLLLDGLMAEREQKITIDVAFRFFHTEKRNFIVADTPGHEEYTRNMAVGASFADLAVILIDATKGVRVQTKRHIRICLLFGIRHFVFAVNKMDAVQYNEEVFLKIQENILNILESYEISSVSIIPVSATEGDNILENSVNMPWFQGNALLPYLEYIDFFEDVVEDGFCMPVQRVCRPDSSFRGYQGQIEYGKVSVGDEVTVLPSNKRVQVKQILEGDKEKNSSQNGHAVTIVLKEETDISRGCVLVKKMPNTVSSMFSATILCMDDKELCEGEDYLLKIGTKMTSAVIIKVKYKINIETGENEITNRVKKNELAKCEFMLTDKVVYTNFSMIKALGAFILIDRISHMTSACGLLESEISDYNNITWNDMKITKEIRIKYLKQNPFTIWFTGLSGSGKSTLANELEKRLVADGKHTMLLDGDNLRMGLNKNLGFSECDRLENIRRIAEVAKILNEAGIIVLVAAISPKEINRKMARDIISQGFIEVYVSTPIEVCEQRDVKGLYSKAKSGEISNFTGISSIYEIPSNPEVEVDTAQFTLDSSVDIIMEKVKSYLTE